MKKFYTFETTYTVTGTICIDTENQEYHTEYYLGDHDVSKEDFDTYFANEKIDDVVSGQDHIYDTRPYGISDFNVSLDTKLTPVTEENFNTKTVDAVGYLNGNNEINGVLDDPDHPFEDGTYHHPDKEFFISLNDIHDQDVRLTTDNIFEKYAKIPFPAHHVRNKYLYDSNTRQWYTMPYEDLFQVDDDFDDYADHRSKYTSGDWQNKWVAVRNQETLARLNPYTEILSQEDDLPF